MKSAKLIGIGALVGIILAAAIYIYYESTKGGTTAQSAGLVEFRPIDKLFTSFAYVPILDMNFSNADISLGGGGDETLSGYCWRQYEVGIGYDSASALFDKYREPACAGRYDELPSPVVLSTNPVSSEAFGDYDRAKCDRWDKEFMGTRRSRLRIVAQLKKDGQWEAIVDNGRKTLAGFIRIYCE
jgi:hypothetical protein